MYDEDVLLTKGKIMKKPVVWVLAAVFGLGAMTAAAADVSLSGFGTVGYAQSNQPYNFERFINSNGTVQRDSVAGVQADIKLTESVGATVQGKFAPSTYNDSSWVGTLSWAFLSWRPANDWLIRLGKQRAPLYLHSESMDVGVTYDFARLPTEMYSLAPTSDYMGGSIEKTWSPSLGELTLDGWVGSAKSSWRFYQRDNVQIPGSPSRPGANFQNFTMDGTGMVLTLLRDEDKYRVSLHKITASAEPGQYFPSDTSLLPAAGFIPAIEQANGLPAGALAGTLAGSAYTVLPQVKITSIDSLVYTLGAEINLPKNFRLTGEYGRRKITNAVIGIDTNAGYLALLKDIDAWTPYVSYALIKSESDVLSLYQAVNRNTNGITALAPAVAAAAAGINASQRVVADGLAVFDQNTIALGTSYRLNSKQIIKAEWARTHVGVASSFVDAPSGGNVSNQDIDVLSFSYNVVF